MTTETPNPAAPTNTQGASPGANPAPGTVQQTPESGAGGDDAAKAAALVAAEAAGAGNTDEAAKAVAAKIVQDAKDALTKAENDRKEAFKVEMDKAVTSWKDTVKADKDLGGEKHEATVIDTEAGIKTFSTPAFAELLEATGLRHHPETVRTFAKLGQMLKEGTIKQGVAAKQPAKSLADLLYPSSSTTA